MNEWRQTETITFPTTEDYRRWALEVVAKSRPPAVGKRKPRYPKEPIKRRRNRNECHYCGILMISKSDPTVMLAPDRMRTKDHVIPRAMGGGEGARNIVFACARCNNDKGCMSYSEFVAQLPAIMSKRFPCGCDLDFLRPPLTQTADAPPTQPRRE